MKEGERRRNTRTGQIGVVRNGQIVPIGTGEDMLKSAGAGVGEGAVGVGSLGGQALLGMLPGGAAVKALDRHFDFIPSQEDIIETAKSYVGDPNAQEGSLYDPATSLGRYTKAGSEGAMYAPLMGATSIPGAVAAGVGMGLGSEAGGDVAALVGGEKWRPTGQLVGAVATGAARGRLRGVGGGKTSTQYAKEATAAGRKLPGEMVTPEAHRSLGSYIHRQINKSFQGDKASGWKPEDAPEITAWLDKFAARKHLDLQGLENLRVSLNPIKGISAGGQSKAAMAIDRAIDQFYKVYKGGTFARDVRNSTKLKYKSKFVEDLANKVDLKTKKPTGHETTQIQNAAIKALEEPHMWNSSELKVLKEAAEGVDAATWHKLAKVARRVVFWGGGASFAGGLLTDNPWVTGLGGTAMAVGGGLPQARANRIARSQFNNFKKVATGGKVYSPLPRWAKMGGRAAAARQKGE
jgi:hypothetical protein